MTPDITNFQTNMAQAQDGGL